MIVCHLTSAHPRYDTRVFVKECCSLANHGNDVRLVVADGRGDECRDGVRILDAGKAGGRLSRMTKGANRVYRLALKQEADVYHLHDPELIPFGLWLKKKGHVVVFDAHEDVPKQILGKPYLGKIQAQVVSRLFSIFENFACKRFDGVIAATPYIADKFSRINKNVVAVNNFPVIGELEPSTSQDRSGREICYVGGLTRVRGISEIVAALPMVRADIRLNLAGAFGEASLEQEVKSHPGWERVDELGFLNRSQIREVLGRSSVGLVTLHPLINYLDALPVKMFEYMAAGVPFVASNFPLWKEIAEESDCGVCVDPLDPQAIASAIDFLIANPERAVEMGVNGRRAVLEKYNWLREKEKLIRFYGVVKGKERNG